MPEAVATPEIIEAAGLRWIHIESPRERRSRLARGALRLPPARLSRTSTRATSGRSSTSTTTTSSSSCTSRCSTRTAARILTAELDLFLGPDYLITLPNMPLPPLTAMFERYREQGRTCASEVFSKGSGYLLYKIVDTGVDASFPMLRKMGLKLERIEDDIFEGRSSEIVRDISEAKQEIINFRQDRPAAARRAARPRADEAALPPGRARDLLRRHLRRRRADLGHPRELQGGRRGLESTNESVLSHRLNDSFRILTAASVVLLPLTLIASIFGMNVPVPGRGPSARVLAIMVLDGGDARGPGRLLPAARLAVGRVAPRIRPAGRAPSGPT